MSDIVSPLLQWLNANPELAGFTTFMISAAESVAIIGTIVPGSITMTAIGALAGAGVIPLYETIIWAMLGAIAGDGISYWMGHYFKDRLRNIWPFRNNPGILAKGEQFVHKYGVMSVFIGRFVGPVRALVPLVAGMLGMKPLRFAIANITSAIGWAPAYMLPGILLGAASLELPPDIAVHVILVLFLLFLFTLLCLWFIYKSLQLINSQTEHLLRRIWLALKKSRYFNVATIVLKHHDDKQHYGQLTLAFYFILTSFLLICLTFYVKYVGAQTIFVNDAMFHMARGLRSDSADTVMLAITLLGQKEVILPVLLVLFTWLVFTKRMRAAFHALALGILAGGSVYVIKHLAQSPRPWGIAASPETFSMPSGHTTLATTVYLGIAFMIAATLSRKRRWMIYTPAVICAFAVGISRIYLGAHWFTDIIAAWLLSAAVLIIVILSYNREREKQISIPGITFICSITLLISYSVFWHFDASRLKTMYTQIDWPTVEVAMNDWWANDDVIPALRVSLFGFPSRPINIEWAGDINDIRSTLLAQGWEIPADRDWISILHRISDIKSGDFLPLISPQYLDKRPVLTLVRTSKELRRLLVIQLWASSRVMQTTKTPLWVGTLGIVPRSYSWLFRKKNHDFEMTPSVVFSKSVKNTRWEWKEVTQVSPNRSNKMQTQHILLLRSHH
jgi:membrane protein DedA with SNARE-associated domain/membrane-associated phospholipid phosphatase